MAEDLIALRSSVLTAHAAEGPVALELLAYNENRFDAARYAGLTLPLPDEPHLEAWSEYATEARHLGVVPTLQKRFVQMRFPVAEGISRSDEYRAATRRGIFPAATGGPQIHDPAGIELVLHPTLSGRIPLLIAHHRADFVTLVQVFSGRNEPIRVPDSMGACIVTGLNNWDRVATHRRRFEAAGGAADEDAWLEEFQRLVPQKSLYQDRFIILSRGPYSAVPAAAVGRAEDEWLRLSLEIRRDHECTHYFTCRVFGSMRNNLLDEIIADFAGLLTTFGHYDGDLALRFFGLEAYPAYREGGRLQSYLGDPPLSAPAVSVLRSLVFQAVRNLENFTDGHEALESADAGARMVVALTAMTLEELASPDMAARLDARLPPPAHSLRLTAPGNEAGIRKVLVGFEAFVRSHPALQSIYADFGVVLDEVVSNVVKYGYRGGSERPVVVDLTLRDDGLAAEVIDEAPPFNPLEHAEPRTDQPLEERPVGGLGIHIVKQLMDDVAYERVDERNHLRFKKRLPAR